MVKMCCGGGLRFVYASSIATTESRFASLRFVYARFVSTASSHSHVGLLGPPEIHSELHKTSVAYVVSPFSPPLTIHDYRLIGKPCHCLFRKSAMICRPNHYEWESSLEKSWSKDPLTTLRIIGYLKHNTRTSKYKHGRQHFYNAALWLHTHHPKTLAGNIKAFSELGCLKDWPELLHCLVRGPFVREADVLERMRARRAKSMRLMAKKSGKFKASETNNDNDSVLGSMGERRIQQSKEERRIQQARQAVKMYKFDPCYRALHDTVSDLFAELLKSDLEFLDSGEVQKISWASKWCPSLGSSYDRSTLLCESIARRLFPYDESSYRGIEEAHYAYRVRDRLRKQVLVPLRRALELPEIYMSNKQWDLLPYEHVKLAAMRTYTKLFIRHDKSRFLRYIRREQQGHKVGNRDIKEQLLPHEIRSLLGSGCDREALEEQWRRMVETLSRQASELSDGPWNGKFLTQTGFKVAHFVEIGGDNLQSKMQCLEARSHSSDYLCARTLLDKILETAVCGKVGREKMVKRLFLMSSFVIEPLCWEKMREKYEQCGYVMPDLVYWESGFPEHSKYVQVSSDRDGVTSIIGYSPSCFQVFMEKDGKLEQDILLEAELAEEEYKELKVLD